MNTKMTAIALSLLLAGGTAAAQGNPYEQFAVQFADGSVISAPDVNLLRTCNVRVAFPDPFGGSMEVAFDVSWVFNPRNFTMEPYHAEEAVEDCSERPMPEVPAYIYEGQQYEGPEGYGEPHDDQYDDQGEYGYDGGYQDHEYGPEGGHHEYEYGPDGGYDDHQYGPGPEGEHGPDHGYGDQPYGDYGSGEYGPHEGGDDYYPEDGEWDDEWEEDWGDEWDEQGDDEWQDNEHVDNEEFDEPAGDEEQDDSADESSDDSASDDETQSAEQI